MTTQRLLTPPGTGAIATLEVAGPQAWDVVRSLFHPAGGKPLPPQPVLHRVWFGRLGEAAGDEVVVGVRQLDPPILEIHSHGGRRVVQWVTNLFSQQGVMPQPRSDESPWSLLEQAPTVRTAGVLLDQCHGAFERRVRDLLASPSPAKLARLAALGSVGRHLIAPWKVVIAGAPNVGKSSLVNAIAGYQRSITSPVAGTTRDVVTTFAALDGWPVELADTAGLRVAAESLEASGIDLARRFLREADLIVWLLDGSDVHAVWPGETDGDPTRRVMVVNKADQPTATALPDDLPRISATSGEGIAALIAEIVARLVPFPPQPGEGVPYTPALADIVQAANNDPANGLPLLAGVVAS
ncbi:GTPase [Limnoglobus roseus]|uniref:GTP-binding protein n=1 Tax=Limnoglobus roseus TaxID=2598579 RepID=A0A5C1ALB3_9BACT|nr:GTPase [Limnoglobus roseus]QEL18977.1 GTP-binding protein [Limnoglobus roseus]